MAYGTTKTASAVVLTLTIQPSLSLTGSIIVDNLARSPDNGGLGESVDQATVTFASIGITVLYVSLAREDDCPFRGDDVCDDGGPDPKTGAATSGVCPFGSDQMDCGTRNAPSGAAFLKILEAAAEEEAATSAPAKEVTLVLMAGGTVEEYGAKAAAVKASLREELQCSLPACELTVTVAAGSVILTVVATDFAAGASQVESAVVALQTKPLDLMSSVLGVTIQEAPAAPSVVDVQVQVLPPAQRSAPQTGQPYIPSYPGEPCFQQRSIHVSGRSPTTDLVAFSPNPNPNPNPSPSPNPNPRPNPNPKNQPQPQP